MSHTDRYGLGPDSKGRQQASFKAESDLRRGNPRQDSADEATSSLVWMTDSIDSSMVDGSDNQTRY